MKKVFCNYCGCSEEKRIPHYRPEYKEHLCYSCYEHYKLHPVNPIPPKGVVALDEEGRIICHICGRAYDRLVTHVRYKHGVTKAEYTEEFGLNRTQRLTSDNHNQYLRARINPTKDVREVSKGTWYGHGQIKPREGKPARLQAHLNRSGLTKQSDIPEYIKIDFCNHYNNNCAKCPYCWIEPEGPWCRAVGKYVY